MVSLIKTISLISLILSNIAFASNQNPWKPTGKDRCGFQKFKCPRLQDLCVRKPKKKSCERITIIKTGKTNKINYVDYCAENGKRCVGRYDYCQEVSNPELMVSIGGTVNPYAECAPKQ